ncbi:MAG: Rieske (2Fe-2S) protein [Chloroflexia bacterium]|nr:Rieske (2Fe-2S) protein [Chloroflexia bacterium]
MDNVTGTRSPAPEVDEHWMVNRRRALKWLIRAGYGAFALAFALPALALRALSQQQSEVASGDPLVYASNAGGGTAGQPVMASDLAVGDGIQAFPQGKDDNQTNLIQIVRLGDGEGAEGLVAYSAICTHLGCVVYADLNQDGNIACPCHNSQFDPTAEAEVTGGPADRALPSIELSVTPEGIISVAGRFSGPIGPS